jgi:uncharacterized LabA/DUF88 family protein
VSKNVAVFVDVANIFYAAKAAGADIDYVTLLKAAVAGRDFVRAYAYTGLDPENENQRNFHAFLARNNYKVVSKDIRKYGDGKVKANLDIELVVDMMKTARNLDVAVVISGDGDFAPAIRAVQEMGVRVEVISFRGNTSSDLIEVADVFTDIIQVARVDRDSSRSGRRVAGDEEDLSMTEVPDKQTEGRGGRRGRGRARDSARTPDVAVAASAGPVERDGRGGGRVAGRGVAGGRTAALPVAPSSGHFVVMPGEKLSRVQPADAEATEEAGEEPEEIVEGLEAEAGADEQIGEGTGRRRRRRGGRGRGHGGRTPEETLAGPQSEGVADEAEEAEGTAEADEAEPVAASAPASRPNQFGSIWDSQIGMAGRPARLAPISPDEDDFAEPEIPEYLLAERRRGGGGGGGGRGRGQGGRGGARSAYASAVDRERYGRASTRYPEPARQSQPQGQPQAPRRRDERPARPVQPPQHRGLPRGGGRDSNEPWSEVPPELEELLRAQLATKLSRPVVEQPAGSRAEGAAETPESSASAEAAVKPAARRGGRRKVEATTEQGQAVESVQPAAPEAAAAEAPAPVAKPATRSRRKPAAAAATAETAESAEAPAPSAEPAEPAAPKRRAPARRKPAGTEPAGE